MSAKDSPKLPKTDWAKIDALTDAEIDTSESLLDEDFFSRAELRLPEKHRAAVTLNIDVETLAWFQAQEDCETRVNAALKLYAEAHAEVFKETL